VSYEDLNRFNLKYMYDRWYHSWNHVSKFNPALDPPPNSLIRRPDLVTWPSQWTLWKSNALPVLSHKLRLVAEYATKQIPDNKTLAADKVRNYRQKNKN